MLVRSCTAGYFVTPVAGTQHGPEGVYSIDTCCVVFIVVIKLILLCYGPHSPERKSFHMVRF